MKIKMAQDFIEICNIKFQEHPHSRSQVVIDTVTSICTHYQKRKQKHSNREIITTLYLHMHTCMNTLCGILNFLAQNIT